MTLFLAWDSIVLSMAFQKYLHFVKSDFVEKARATSRVASFEEPRPPALRLGVVNWM